MKSYLWKSVSSVDKEEQQLSTEFHRGSQMKSNLWKSVSSVDKRNGNYPQNFTEVHR